MKTGAIDTLILVYFQREFTKEKHQKRIIRVLAVSPLPHDCLELGEGGPSCLPGCSGWGPWK